VTVIIKHKRFKIFNTSGCHNILYFFQKVRKEHGISSPKHVRATTTTLLATKADLVLLHTSMLRSRYSEKVIVNLQSVA
jgi:hypothetical protein